jgi:hypothetical protein
LAPSRSWRMAPPGASACSTRCSVLEMFMEGQGNQHATGTGGAGSVTHPFKRRDALARTDSSCHKLPFGGFGGPSFAKPGRGRQ